MTQGFPLKMYNILYKFAWGRWVDFWWALLNYDEPWKKCLHKIAMTFQAKCHSSSKKIDFIKNVSLTVHLLLRRNHLSVWHVLVGLSIRISGITGFPIVIVCIVINFFIFRFVFAGWIWDGRVQGLYWRILGLIIWGSGHCIPFRQSLSDWFNVVFRVSGAMGSPRIDCCVQIHFQMFTSSIHFW